MNNDQFWEIIQSACQSDRRRTEEWSSRLTELLAKLEAEEILEWDNIFEQFVAAAYTVDLIAACCFLNAGAGDDGFYYFRCWLVGMGQDIYSAAITDADSLVEVALPLSEGIDAEAEIYGAARQAWMEVTGLPDTAAYPVRTKPAELIGEDWDCDDPKMVRQRLPRLSAFYSE